MVGGDPGKTKRAAAGARENKEHEAAKVCRATLWSVMLRMFVFVLRIKELLKHLKQECQVISLHVEKISLNTGQETD